MYNLYFEDKLTTRQLQDIWNWCYAKWGLDNGWTWIRTANKYGSYFISGIALQTEEDALLLKLSFPYAMVKKKFVCIYFKGDFFLEQLIEISKWANTTIGISSHNSDDPWKFITTPRTSVDGNWQNLVIGIRLPDDSAIAFKLKFNIDILHSFEPV